MRDTRMSKKRKRPPKQVKWQNVGRQPDVIVDKQRRAGLRCYGPFLGRTAARPAFRDPINDALPMKHKAGAPRIPALDDLFLWDQALNTERLAAHDPGLD
jgi:hypothetical protein